MTEIERQTEFNRKLLSRLESIDTRLGEINQTLKNFGNFMAEPVEASENSMRNDAYE